MPAHTVATTKENGLDAVKLTHSSGASALVYVYGAHLASWQTSDGEEQLFVSSTAEYGGGKAIRGGVPICWPQFADRGSGPKHGVCRASAEWTVVRTPTEPYPCVAPVEKRPVWPRLAQAADRPRLAEARGSLEHRLALNEARESQLSEVRATLF